MASDNIKTFTFETPHWNQAGENGFYCHASDAKRFRTERDDLLTLLARREEQMREMCVMGGNAACNLMAAITMLSGDVEYGETLQLCKKLRDKAQQIIDELEEKNNVGMPGEHN